MLTVAECLDFYYKEHIAKKAVARRRAEYAIEAMKRHIPDENVYDIDVPACREYCDERIAEGVTESTIRRELSVLGAAARHNVKWRRLKITDLPTIELPAEGAPKRLWLFKEELEKLLGVAESIDRRAFRFLQIAYHTGSRKAAIERLQWSQVDLTARRINLHPPGQPLTKKRRPIVPISEAIAQELAIMKSKSINQWVLGSPDNIRPAFDRVASASGLAELKNQGLRQAGRLSPHVLRHSRATHLLQDGKSPWAVANLLGDSLTTVLRVYGHACPDYLDSVI